MSFAYKSGLRLRTGPIATLHEIVMIIDALSTRYVPHADVPVETGREQDVVVDRIHVHDGRTVSQTLAFVYFGRVLLIRSYRHDAHQLSRANAAHVQIVIIGRRYQPSIAAHVRDHVDMYSTCARGGGRRRQGFMRRSAQIIVYLCNTLFPPGEPLGHAEAARAGGGGLQRRWGLLRGGPRREETGYMPHLNPTYTACLRANASISIRCDVHWARE
jgi:hypothetical protein